MRHGMFFRRSSVLYAAVLLLASCGWFAPAPPTPTPEPRVLRVYTVRDTTIDGVVQIISDGFRERHPDVQIELIYGDGSYSELQPNASARVVPDVVWLPDVFTAALVESGALLDVEELARSDQSINLADVHPAALEPGRSRSRPGLFMIPVSLETIQMYYNRTLWQRSGAPLPQEDWTWDDLIAACTRLQEASPGVNCLSFTNVGLAGYEWWAYWLPWVRGAGGDALGADGAQSTLSSPAAIEGLQGYADLWLKHKIAAPPGAPRNDCFVAQTCAAFFSLAGAARTYRERVGDRFDWDVQLVPSHPRGRFTGIGTHGFAVTRAASDPQLAWDFVKYTISTEGQRAVAMAYLGAPVLMSLGDDPALAQLPPPPANARAFITGRAFGIAPPVYPPACGSVYNGLVQSAVAGALEQVIRGAVTVEEAFTAADRHIQECLDANR